MKKIKRIAILLTIILILLSAKNFAEEIISISEIKPGDFVDYTAGLWTEEEINKLKESNLYSEISIEEEGQASYQFNGFYVGTSKDESIAETEKFPKGWRVLSNKSNTIKIISSGVTEGYYSVFGDNCAYLSYYILNGEKHPYDNTSIVDEKDFDIRRDWSMYENLEFARQGSAHCITGQEAFDITGSYSATSNDLRNIDNHYMTSSLHCDQDLWTVEQSGKMDRWGGYYGIRPVVILKNNLSAEKIGEYNGYNIWRLINNGEEEIIDEIEDDGLSDIEKLLNESRSAFSEEENIDDEPIGIEETEPEKDNNENIPINFVDEDFVTNNNDSNNYRLLLLIIIIIIVILILTFIFVLIIFCKSKKNNENNQ